MSDEINNVDMEEPSLDQEETPAGPSQEDQKFVESLFEFDPYAGKNNDNEPTEDNPEEPSGQGTDDFDQYIQSQIADVPDVKSDGISAPEHNSELDR